MEHSGVHALKRRDGKTINDLQFLAVNECPTISHVADILSFFSPSLVDQHLETIPWKTTPETTY